MIGTLKLPILVYEITDPGIHNYQFRCKTNRSRYKNYRLQCMKNSDYVKIIVLGIKKCFRYKNGRFGNQSYMETGNALHPNCYPFPSLSAGNLLIKLMLPTLEDSARNFSH